MVSAEWTDRASGWAAHTGAVSLRGNYRQNNEDRVHIDDEFPFALVLDGMGGMVAGETASRTAAATVRRELRRGLRAGAEPRELIAGALRAANERLLELGRRDSDMRNMGTTIVLALLHGGRVYVSWLGDSPAFLVSGDRIEKLTWEHDTRNALIRAGAMTAAEAREHRIRNVLWRYLGSPEPPEAPEVRTFDPRPGDRLLLATDGVTGVLAEPELLDLCRAHPDPRVCAEALVNVALERGSRDNCTCAAVAFEWAGAGPPPEPSLSLPSRRWWQFWK